MGNLQINGGLKVNNSIETSNIIANGQISATSFIGSLTGTATAAARTLPTKVIYGDSHALALKSEFDTYKNSIPREELLTYASGAYDDGSLYMGYFINDYDSTPYGGFYVAHYDTPYYVGISYGNYNQQTILTSSNYATWCAPASHSHDYLPLSGGTMTGTIVTPGNDSVVIKPAKNNYDQIGASDCKFWKIHASTFIGNLTGNADTATTASAVAWGNVTDKPSSFTPSSHSHSHIEYVDTRNINQSPNDLQAGLTIHLKANGADGLSDDGSYHAVVGIKDWNDYSGGPYGQLAITANHMWFRNSNSGTAWNYWRKILDSSNYTSYTVTKTGDGASGTWNINALKASQASKYLHAGASGYHLIKIKDLNEWMTAFTVRLYQAYRYTDIVISGYNYGANHWYSPAASMIGTSGTTPIEVQFGYDSSNYLWVAIPAGNYYGIDIINTTNGYTQFNSYAGLFEISQVSSIPSTFQTSRMAYPPVLADYGTTLPAAGQAGRIFFKKVT